MNADNFAKNLNVRLKNGDVTVVDVDILKTDRRKPMSRTLVGQAHLRRGYSGCIGKTRIFTRPPSSISHD